MVGVENFEISASRSQSARSASELYPDDKYTKVGSPGIEPGPCFPQTSCEVVGVEPTSSLTNHQIASHDMVRPSGFEPESLRARPVGSAC